MLSLAVIFHLHTARGRNIAAAPGLPLIWIKAGLIA
jgi:hypothetical protein